jgi:hypothetical protein
MTVPALIEDSKTWKLVKIDGNEADEVTGLGNLPGETTEIKTNLLYAMICTQHVKQFRGERSKMFSNCQRSAQGIS